MKAFEKCHGFEHHKGKFGQKRHKFDKHGHNHHKRQQKEGKFGKHGKHWGRMTDTKDEGNKSDNPTNVDECFCMRRRLWRNCVAHSPKTNKENQNRRNAFKEAAPAEQVNTSEETGERCEETGKTGEPENVEQHIDILRKIVSEYFRRRQEQFVRHLRARHGGRFRHGHREDNEGRHHHDRRHHHHHHKMFRRHGWCNGYGMVDASTMTEDYSETEAPAEARVEPMEANNETDKEKETGTEKEEVEQLTEAIKDNFEIEDKEN